MRFWKRKELHLQYQWGTFKYEETEERERPSFVYALKTKAEDKREKYRVYNPVLKRYEYFQPPKFFWPKVVVAFSVLSTFALAVIGIIIVIIIYRLAVSRTIYQQIRKFDGSTGVASLITIITGSCFQLVAIVLMDIVYERVAIWLTNWGQWLMSYSIQWNLSNQDTQK